MLQRFLKQHRLSWDTLVRIYHTVIVQTALYGLKVATLTKRNCESLKRMEGNIINNLIELAKDKPQALSIKELLKGKTIIKKSMVGRLKYWGHVMRRPANHILRRAIEYQVKGKYKVGRPCFAWNSTLKKDITRSKMVDWIDTIDDAKAHDKKCESVYPTDGDESD